MGNPAGKGHHFGGNLKSGHTEPPAVGQKVDQPQPPVKGPNVTVTDEKFDPKLTKVGIGQGSESWANTQGGNITGKSESFNTNLPPVEKMFDDKGNLKPEIEAEAQKASRLANEPALQRQAAKKEADDMQSGKIPTPQGAVQLKPSPGISTQDLDNDPRPYYKDEENDVDITSESLDTKI